MWIIWKWINCKWITCINEGIASEVISSTIILKWNNLKLFWDEVTQSEGDSWDCKFRIFLSLFPSFMAQSNPAH